MKAAFVLWLLVQSVLMIGILVSQGKLEDGRSGWKERLCQAGVCIINWLDLMRKFPSHTASVLQLLKQLSSGKAGLEEVRLYYGVICISMVGSHLLFTFLCCVTEDALALYAAGIVLTIMLPAVRMKQLKSRVDRRKTEVAADMPELLDKLALLINAGETIQAAWKRCSQEGSMSRPLYIELRKSAAELERQVSFSRVMEGFHKRCGVQDTSVFTNTVLMNYRKGGNDLVLSLRELSRQLWEKKRSAAKTAGEEASAKMVMPLMIVFVVILLVVAAPGVMMMN
ncbi:type II secretion system F family protein [Paenibacillus gansuensis]|uniref:Type II secretion system F family protein n=1 Tax=Paenibacillus gansuensis TaxID=306542 RepID=A0ABW5PCH7_9BACL